MKTICAVLPLALAAGSTLLTTGCSSFPELRIKSVEDFEVNGSGEAEAWKSVAWTPMRKRQPDGHPYDARFKVVYSKTGVYVLMDGTDIKLTTTGRPDNANLWEEDVYEAFFWPDESVPVYFEYEISPMNAELPIMVPNNGGSFMGWLPWHFEKDRKTRKATAVKDGAKTQGGPVKGWSAEFFIPFALLRGLQNVPPAAGARWRANFYRMDHDGGKTTQWDWAPVGPSFHEFRKYGVLIFE
jgi:cellulose/xylan binding protein with CBM9 domain